MVSRIKKIHIAITCYVANLTDFYDIAILSVAVPYIVKEFGMSTGQAGILGTATLLGCGVSALMWGWVADNFGRRKAMLLSVVCFSIFTGLIGLTHSFIQILIVRFIGGISLGGIFTLVGTYINENWAPKHRAKTLSLVMTSSFVGILMSGVITKIILVNFGWRPLFLIAFAVLAAAVYMYFCLPESAEWLRAKERKDAGEAIEKIPLGQGLKTVFTGQYAKRTIFASLASFFAQTTYWAFNFWLPTYLVNEIGATPGQLANYVMFQTVGGICAFIIGGFVADKIGRKNILLVAFFVGGIVFPIFTSLTSFSQVFLMAPFMACIFVYPSIFGGFFAELYPVNIRALGGGLNMNIGRGMSAVGPFVAAILIQSLGMRTLVSGLIIPFVMAGICMLFLPDVLHQNRKKAKKEAEGGAVQ